jgi:hypothetical protein
LKGKKLLKACDPRKVAREWTNSRDQRPQHMRERERERERGMASGQEKNVSIGFQLPPSQQTTLHQTHTYCRTISNNFLISLLNWAIFMSLDAQTGGLQMFFERQK